MDGHLKQSSSMKPRPDGKGCLLVEAPRDLWRRIVLLCRESCMLILYLRERGEEEQYPVSTTRLKIIDRPWLAVNNSWLCSFSRKMVDGSITTYVYFVFERPKINRVREDVASRIIDRYIRVNNNISVYREDLSSASEILNLCRISSSEAQNRPTSYILIAESPEYLPLTFSHTIFHSLHTKMFARSLPRSAQPLRQVDIRACINPYNS
jgi:hypothetical protein